MPTDSPDPAPSSTSSLSPHQREQLAAVAAALKEGRLPGRPKQRPTTEELRARAHAYWDHQSPQAKRIHTLAGRIAVGRAAERELAELLHQLEVQQQDGGDA